MEDTEKGHLAEFVISLLNHPACETAAEYAEVAVDSLLEDGILKDLPFFSTLISMYHSVVSIRDRLLLKQLCSFLQSIEDVPEKTRSNFVASLERQGKRKEVGEKIIFIIDRQDDARKASIIGEIFRHYLLGKIDQNDFFLLCHCVNLCHTVYLERLWEFESGFDAEHHSVAKALALAGIAEWDINTSEMIWDGNSLGSSIHYELNTYGYKLSNILKTRAERHNLHSARVE